MRLQVGWLALIVLVAVPLVASAGPPPDTGAPSRWGSALPPPGINDPGVVARPATSAGAGRHAPAMAASIASKPVPPLAVTRPQHAASESVPLPDTGIPPSLAPALREEEGKGDNADMTVHTKANGDKVEEYGRNGVVYMVRVIPKHGVPQTYRRNSPNGSLMPDPALGPVAPVYYDIYQWGAGKKPASGRSD